jgi:hypothetical protein
MTASIHKVQLNQSSARTRGPGSTPYVVQHDAVFARRPACNALRLAYDSRHEPTIIRAFEALSMSLICFVLQ